METQSFWEPLWLSVPLLTIITLAVLGFSFFVLRIKIRNYFQGIYRVNDNLLREWSGYYLTTGPDGKAKQFGKEVKLEKGERLFEVYLTTYPYASPDFISSMGQVMEKEMPLFKISANVIFEFDISDDFDPQLIYDLLVLPEITLEKYLDNVLKESLQQDASNPEFEILLEKLAHGEANGIGVRYQIGKLIKPPQIPFKNIRPAGITIGKISLTVI